MLREGNILLFLVVLAHDLLDHLLKHGNGVKRGLAVAAR